MKKERGRPTGTGNKSVSVAIHARGMGYLLVSAMAVRATLHAG